LGGSCPTLTTPIVRQPATCSGTSPHFPLVAPSAASVGDLAMVPSSSPWPAALPRGTLVLEGSVPEVLESPMPKVQEVSERPSRDGSNATLL
jgi:hypothetical protein